MRPLLAILACCLLLSSAWADRAPARPKATAASVTVKRDGFAKVAGELRKLAATAPPKLTAEQLKAYDGAVAEMRKLADDADGVAKKLAAGLSGKASQKELDSMSEMGETESLRLRQAMDRLSKLLSTISNLLKKSSDTMQTLTQNLK
jgi:hypothetical protein